MPLQILAKNTDSGTLNLALDGQLDTLTATDLDKSLQNTLTAEIKTLILDLQSLTFVSSAGLRIFAKARKIMKSREGRIYFTNPTPQVQKVFDIVKAVPLSDVFVSTEELDAYLTVMQTTIDEEND